MVCIGLTTLMEALGQGRKRENTVTMTTIVCLHTLHYGKGYAICSYCEISSQIVDSLSIQELSKQKDVLKLTRDIWHIDMLPF